MRPRFQPLQGWFTFAVVVVSQSDQSPGVSVVHYMGEVLLNELRFPDCVATSRAQHQPAGSSGKMSACIRCHIDTAGRVLLRQYLRLVSLGASLRLRAGNSFRGRRGVRGGRGFCEVCQLLSDTSIVNVCACGHVCAHQVTIQSALVVHC